MKAKERRKAPEITPRLLRSYLLQDNAAPVRTPCSGVTWCGLPTDLRPSNTIHHLFSFTAVVRVSATSVPIKRWQTLDQVVRRAGEGDAGRSVITLLRARFKEVDYGVDSVVILVAATRSYIVKVCET
ncbi:hypothetical protein Zmor_000815 [Zophobas morio]|uniref:Uncharacterized protein n=1 Tax=Zophobas morio TaxID=2755281 RepID=A0AA38MNT9_9CUCU|nr:hypothetical protein Zmor_000815 [Zophobas morio]